MGKIISISEDELKQIKEATTYGQISNKIVKSFKQSDSVISSLSKVIPSASGNRLYIIDKTGSYVNVFFIEFIESDEDEIQVELSHETPTHSPDINDYPVFKVGLPFPEMHIDGKERAELTDEKQIQKWDYFFQASSEELSQRHLFLIDEFTESKEKYKQKSIGQIIGILLFVLVLIIIFYQWSPLATIIIGVIFLWKFGYTLLRLFRNIQRFLFLKKVVKKIEDEKEFLVDQIEQSNVSGKQMEKWLDEEINALDKKAVEELNFPEERIIRKELSEGRNNAFDFENSILGLTVREYGFIQPLTANGKRTIERRYPHHLKAYRHRKNNPLAGIYLISFIYMTPETIGFSGFFYDFILAKRFGKITKQYYYRDIVSIGTRVCELEIFTNQEELETEQVLLQFYNNEVIAISLTDKVAIENLRDRVDKRPQTNDLDSDLDSDTPDFDQLLHAPIDELPGTKARFIVETIKTYWSQMKNGRLPPGEKIDLID
jgi:hypothetical protein